ncbi:hypothetical protein JW979_11165 [bacterium]|nr:hypothetical protein [candidate division CSSED10-310 bacterium]
MKSYIKKDQDNPDVLNRDKTLLAWSCSMASQIAHEFNNLLSPLAGIPDLLMSKASLPPDVITLLGHIKNAAEQIIDINRSLMMIAKRRMNSCHSVSYNTIVETVRDTMDIPNHCRVFVEEPSPDLFVRADEIQCLHAVTVLLRVSARLADTGSNLHVTFDTSKALPDNQISQGICMVITWEGKPLDEMLQSIIHQPFDFQKIQHEKRDVAILLKVTSVIIRDQMGRLEYFEDGDNRNRFVICLPSDRLS